MKPRILAVWVSWVVFNALNAFAGAVDWPQLQGTQVATGLQSPTHIANAGDGSGRLFVTEQPGRIRIVTNGLLSADAFLDIMSEVDSDGIEQGLLCVAFSPGYATNGFFYVNYTRRPDGATVVSRFSVSTTNTDVADPSSESVILTVPQPYDNHNGGQLAFGRDGYLYIGMGDGGSEGDPDNQAQDPGSLLGKLLRIEVSGTNSSYAIPPGNPFVTNGTFRPEIWALGLRNPWRFSFDRLSGDLYVADVGQDNREEIDFQPHGSAGGQNYGWRIMEGNHSNNVPPGFPVNQLTAPVAEYSHSLGTAVTGGFVRRGPGPSRMNGIYFFGDYGSGRIWGLKFDGAAWQMAQLAQLGSFGVYISTFGEDEAGRIYFASYYAGTIYQLEDNGAANPPVPTPGKGTYATEQLVTMNCLTPDASIHYTTNGLDPTEADPAVAPGGVVPVNSTLTLKARAFRGDLTPSAVVSVSYTLKAAMPVFSPSVSPVTNGTVVAITCATSNAIVRFTLDGSDPNSGSPVYGGPFALNGNTTLNARAFKPGFNDSDIRSVFFGLLDYERSIVTTVAGNGQAGWTDGPAALAQFSWPRGICLDAMGNVLVADTGNHVIRKITPQGFVSTIAGTGGQAGFTNGPATNALFSSPIDVCLDRAGNLFVSDWGNYRIRKIDPAGMVSTFAGSGIAGILDGPAGTAQFGDVRYLAIDLQTNLYASDWGKIRKIDLSGTVSSFAGSGVNRIGDVAPDAGLCMDRNGNLLAGTWYGWMLLINPAGSVSTYAGTGSGSADGPRLAAQLSGGSAFYDTASDRFGNAFWSDGTRVRKISPGGWVSTLAGLPAAGGFVDGSSRSARFGQCNGICVDGAGTVYVVDTTNHAIRKIEPLLNITGFTVSNGVVQLTWRSSPGSSYFIETSEDLQNWNILGTVQATNTETNLIDPLTAAAQSQRVYRLRLSE